MKNKEKFAKEILEIACDGSDIAVDKATGKPVHCEDIKCSACMFNGKICSTALKEWAESEYIEKPAITVISKKDRGYLLYLIPKLKYIARDRGGSLRAFSGKPDKKEDMWELGYLFGECNLTYGHDLDFPMVKWEDEEPWLIEDLKKLEVVEDYE